MMCEVGDSQVMAQRRRRTSAEPSLGVKVGKRTRPRSGCHVEMDTVIGLECGADFGIALIGVSVAGDMEL